MSSHHPSPHEARNMLAQAGQLEASVHSTASWAHVTMLLGLGAISALSLVAFGLVGKFDESFVFYPMLSMFVWLGIFMVTMFLFGKSTKVGFSTRWRAYMALWGVLWVAGVLGTTTLFAGQMWFAVLAAALITVATTACAWSEARR